MLLSAMESLKLKRIKTMQQITGSMLLFFFTVSLSVLNHDENKRSESNIGFLINNFRDFLKNLSKSNQQFDIVVINGILQKDHAKVWPIRNNKKCYQQHDHKWYGSFVEFSDGFIKTVACNKQVHSYRGCKITDLHIG
jgi:hypothetical protein